jgi:NhaA family Na+:H+ antiporter
LGGIVLAVAAILALIVANSPPSGLYAAFLNVPAIVKVGAFEIVKPLLLWINDGLMAVFFLVVGLEIKREFLAGELNSAPKAALPLVAATGGFVLPSLIFALLNWNSPATLNAWAVPSATDIAFVVGLIAALGRMVPLSLKVFVLAVAIIDDLMAVIVIALFYTANLSLFSLSIAAICLVVLFAFNRLGIRSMAPFLLVGLVMWASVLKSGVHATLAGVALGLMIPLRADGRGESMLERLEHGLAPWVTFFIVPVFAFANAGVPLSGSALGALSAPLTLGIILGLFIGKQAGIFGATWLAIRLGLSPKPAGASWMQIYGIALLTGIGFTMSLFIGSLAISDPALQDQIRIGVLVGSLLSAAAGALVLLVAARRMPGQVAIARPE